MMKRSVMELWVGVFVAAGVIALGVLAFRVANLTAGDVVDGYTIAAHFDNIGGLKVKSAVTLSGVRVGRVSRIYYDKDTYQAVVEMTVDGRYNNIPEDTGASILTSGLLGEQYVGLEPGGAETYLKNGDRLKLTQSALVLEKLVGQFLFNAAAKPEGAGEKTK
jgi:phospholipid/cholesterol/gamma-HCH transport system substrate-binding protein